MESNARPVGAELFAAVTAVPVVMATRRGYRRDVRSGRAGVMTGGCTRDSALMRLARLNAAVEDNRQRGDRQREDGSGSTVRNRNGVESEYVPGDENCGRTAPFRR